MALLRRKRGVVKAALTRLRNYVKEFDQDQLAISLLEFRQEELPNINKKFDSVQSEIELISEEPDKEEDERASFERDYFEARAQIQEIVIMNKLSSTVGHNATFGSTSNSNRLRLALIPLLTFKDDIENWEAFYDVFQALVHNDEVLTSAQKLYYLMSCLSGPALDIVSSIPMTDNYYEVFLRRLKQRYDNKSLVIQTHIRALLDAPRVETVNTGSLQKLHSHIGSHVAALRALGQPIEHWDAWLVTIVLNCLDKGTAHDWHLRQEDTQLPKYVDIEKFLASRCIAFENSEVQSATQSHPYIPDHDLSSTYQNKIEKKVKKVLATERVQTTKCPCCSENHKLYQCNKFKELGVNERLALVRSSRLCFNCLSGFHAADSCNSRYSCFKCKRKHNSLLHFEKVAEKVEEPSLAGSSSVSVASTTQNPVSLSISNSSSHIFLVTASVYVRDNHGNLRTCRAILDSGSQVNYVSKKMARLLQLAREKVQLPISGIGASKVHSVSRITINMKSRVTDYEVELPCHILPVVINDLPRILKPNQGWNIPTTLLAQLADPSFDQAGSVDLLVGAGTFFELLEAERVQLGTGTVSLQDTRLGWIVTGETNPICLLSVGNSLEEDWKTIINNEDAYGKTSKKNQHCKEENQALEHFQNIFKRNDEGRFVLQLPVKSDLTNLGQSVNVAISRFFSVERKLQQDADLREEYIKFMKEYLNIGHMREIPKELNIPKRSCYLPHHAVFKTSCLTTKVRIVFDASAKTSTGVSQ